MTIDEFEPFPIEDYLPAVRSINGLIDCVYDQNIIEDGESGFFLEQEHTPYWMKSEGEVVGILRYTKGKRLAEIITKGHQALTVKHLTSIRYFSRQISGKEEVLYLAFLIQDINGNLYHQCRLPDGVILPELRLNRVRSPLLFQFPKNLTVMRSVTSVGILDRVQVPVLPDGLTIHGDLHLNDFFPIRQIGDNVKIQGKLTVYAPEGFNKETVGSGSKVESLHLVGSALSVSSVSKLPEIEGNAKIEASGSVRNIQCGGSLEIEAPNKPKGRGIEISNIRCGKHLSIINHNATKISDIRCQDLSVENCETDKLSFSFIPGRVKIKKCESLSIISKGAVCGELDFKISSIIVPGRPRLPSDMVVYGSARLSLSIQIPESFCCLGNLETE